MTRRKRGLSSEDIALWRHVARAVRPLPGRSLPELPKAEPPASPPPHAKALRNTVTPAPKVQPKPALKPILPLERRVKTGLRRGREDIDGILDLHGMTQEVAHGALVNFLYRMQAEGARHVLIITGKGGPPPSGLFNEPFVMGRERGVLRRLVPHWLRLPDLRPLVLAFDEAADRHGGAGALYLTLRRYRGEDA